MEMELLKEIENKINSKKRKSMTEDVLSIIVEKIKYHNLDYDLISLLQENDDDTCIFMMREIVVNKIQQAVSKSTISEDNMCIITVNIIKYRDYKAIKRSL